MVKHHLAKLVAIGVCKMRYEVFNLSHDLMRWILPVIEGSCNFMRWNSSLYVTTLPILKGKFLLTLFRIGFFGAAHGCRGYQKGHCPLTSVTHPTVMEFGTVIPFLNKIQKLYESRDTLLEFCWHQHFSPEVSKFCYIKNYRYRFQSKT